MREIFIIFALLIAGCSAPKSYILENSHVTQSRDSFPYSIGIKTIELPQYLQNKDIPFLKDDKQIIYLKDKKWATYLDEQLTNRLVSTIEKSFNTPKVYKYPQNSTFRPDIILQITINKFIANSHEVILEATYQTKKKSRLFSIQKSYTSKDDIIDAMNQAFSILEKKIVEDLGKRTK